MMQLTRSKKAKKPSPKKKGPEPLTLRRVLVVEDDPILAMATEDTLRESGVEHVDVCPTTEGALESASRRSVTMR